MPGIAGPAEMPETPGLADVLGLADVPGMPGSAEVPVVSGLAKVPVVPGLAEVPGVPGSAVARAGESPARPVEPRGEPSGDMSAAGPGVAEISESTGLPVSRAR